MCPRVTGESWPLQTKWLGKTQIHLESVSSTNDYLAELKDAPEGTVVTAQMQTAGKGRQGHRWESGANAGLYLSFLLSAGRFSKDPGALTLLLGLLTSLALSPVLGKTIELKWPNDLIVEGKKLGGILCERSGDRIICGIGINLKQEKRQGAPYAISMEDVGVILSPQETATRMLETMEPALENFSNMGFLVFLPQYMDRCVTLGKQVLLISHGNETAANAVAVDRSGGLICEIGGERTVVTSGEVSIRGYLGYV